MANYTAPYYCPECENPYWILPPAGKCRGRWRTNDAGAREFVPHTIPIDVISRTRATTGVGPPLQQLQPERKSRRDRTR